MLFLLSFVTYKGIRIRLTDIPARETECTTCNAPVCQSEIHHITTGLSSFLRTLSSA